MKSFLKKAKAELEGAFNPEAKDRHPPPLHRAPLPQEGVYLKGVENDQPNTIQDPTALDVLRYRYHHGTNLGSVYVLERWLSPSMFPDGTSGSSELEAVKAWVEAIGVDETKKKFEEHWANAVSDSDIQWLHKEAKCTTIRLPIGYFDLGPSFVTDTPFEPYASIYANAWDSIRALVSRLRAHFIGTILDLHALPGGANSSDHSGTNSGRTEFWKSATNLNIGIKCCGFLANQTKGGLEIAGIQIVNEADWDSDGMYEYYDHCIETISVIDPSIPVVISDAWDLGQAVQYSLKKNVTYPARPTCPVIIDTHCYWAFSDADKAKSPQQIIAEVTDKLRELDGHEGSVTDRGAVQAIVGEYSCVLTEDSWAKSGDTPKSDLVKQFGQAQTKRWQLRAGGAFFWTWKMDWYPGGEWGFAEQTQNGAVTPHPIQNIPWPEIPAICERARQRQAGCMYDAVNQHTSYWQNTSPNMGFEHWRFEFGWIQGYLDALVFFEGRGTQAVASGNKIGCVELWVLKRIRESGFRGEFVWEFEQGLRRGIKDFEGIVGI